MKHNELFFLLQDVGVLFAVGGCVQSPQSLLELEDVAVPCGVGHEV